MENEIKKVKKQILIIIIFSIIIFGLGIVLENYIGNELVSMFIGFSGSIIGGIATMLAVYATLTYDRSQREKEKCEVNKKEFDEIKNKKNKIKIILKNEIDMFLKYIESDALTQIFHGMGNEFEGKLNLYEEYYIDKNFQEYIYELLMLGETDYEIASCKSLLEFYNDYLRFLKFQNSEIDNDDKKISFIGDILSGDIDLLLYYNGVTLEAKEDYQKQHGNFNFDKKFKDILNEFNLGTIHYSDMTLDLIRFLET